uniref:histone acetyltransferase n=1 Tax=Nelumbo nucifera TaxID=4432 RepID=A0A822YT78_NELNU|nr:TPA_asm: hypothetical protein HUJ06_011279 [Nelumbo nucifera]
MFSIDLINLKDAFINYREPKARMCHDAEQNLDEMNRHPINSKEKHALTQVEVNDVPLHTEDKDDILDNELFENRQTFLSFCQGNHYQYDTLRRAKHSTMMILYHFHNPAVPAVIATCSICYKDIEAGQGWHCEVCSDYDVCAVCYQKEVVDHNHKLIKHPSMANHKIKNREVRKRKALQMRKLLDVLMHASRCAINHCNYPNCDTIKKLFCHSKYCKTRATGGCGHCKKTWFLLRLHSRNCRRMECPVPRCIDIRNHMKRLQMQVDSRRRAAVTEPVRRQESEVAVYCR